MRRRRGPRPPAARGRCRGPSSSAPAVRLPTPIRRPVRPGRRPPPPGRRAWSRRHRCRSSLRRRPAAARRRRGRAGTAASPRRGWRRSRSGSSSFSPALLGVARARRPRRRTCAPDLRRSRRKMKKAKISDQDEPRSPASSAQAPASASRIGIAAPGMFSTRVIADRVGEGVDERPAGERREVAAEGGLGRADRRRRVDRDRDQRLLHPRHRSPSGPLPRCRRRRCGRTRRTRRRSPRSGARPLRKARSRVPASSRWSSRPMLSTPSASSKPKSSSAAGEPVDEGRREEAAGPVLARALVAA